jgi:hypothetical protein
MTDKSDLTTQYLDEYLDDSSELSPDFTVQLLLRLLKEQQELLPHIQGFNRPAIKLAQMINKEAAK